MKACAISMVLPKAVCFPAVHLVFWDGACYFCSLMCQAARSEVEERIEDIGGGPAYVSFGSGVLSKRIGVSGGGNGGQDFF
jgi:hypothetical protein